jgi:hypothetical protein
MFQLAWPLVQHAHLSSTEVTYGTLDLREEKGMARKLWGHNLHNCGWADFPETSTLTF